MSAYLTRAEKILHRINALATISEDQDGLTRTYGSAAFCQARVLLQQWMEEAGLQTRIDAIGNVRGRLPAALATSGTLVLGSHFDTVVNAGKFDGPLGLLMGLDLLEQLAARPVPLPVNAELIGFCDEEGVRFHTTYLGSQVVAGSFDDRLLERKDAGGITLAQAIAAQGGDPGKIRAEALAAQDWLAYFEIHIEQGPVLYQRNIPAAAVTAIAGQHRVEVTFLGAAGHAGTVPMTLRQDALCAAAEFVLAAETYARSQGPDLVATVGKLHIPQEASNVIPGAVTCTLDLRSAGQARLAAAHTALKDLCAHICRQRNIQLRWQLVQETRPVRCHPVLNEWLAAAIGETGHEVLRLVSGAGHDAVPISQVAPATMLFVRCFEGISHNPREEVDLADLAASLRVAEIFISQVLDKYPELPQPPT
jgi:allantoate deiminase